MDELTITPANLNLLVKQTTDAAIELSSRWRNFRTENSPQLLQFPVSDFMAAGYSGLIAEIIVSLEGKRAEINSPGFSSEDATNLVLYLDAQQEFLTDLEEIITNTINSHKGEN